jgi:hypothetical protein
VRIVVRLVAAPDVLRALPWVMRAKWRLRRTRDLRDLVAEHDYSATPPKRPRSIDKIRRGVDGSLRIVGPREDHCVPRALALFALLTRAGYRAVFVSGVRKVGADLRGHAWVLVDGSAVERTTTLELHARYREQFRMGSTNAPLGEC